MHISTLVGHVINFFVNMKTMYCADIILAENKIHLNHFHPKRVSSTCFYNTNFRISTFFIPGKIYNSGVNFNTDSCMTEWLHLGYFRTKWSGSCYNAFLCMYKSIAKCSCNIMHKKHKFTWRIACFVSETVL